MWPFSTPHLPFANGPYIPGCVDVMTEYSKNGLLFRLYYPTNKTSNIKDYILDWVPWIPDESYLKGFARVLMIWMIAVRFTIWLVSGKIHIPVVYGGKIRKDEKLKCIVFSHGLGGGRFFYSTMCIELASRGFLVIAIEHRDESASSTYYYESKENAKSDIKSFINYVPIKLGNNHYTIRNTQVQQRSAECQKLTELLQVINSGVIPYNVLKDVPTENYTEFDLNDLTGLLDVDDMIMMGHSFGAATALLTLGQNKQLRQGIILDPWMFPIKEMPELISTVTQPLLFINTQTFHIISNVKVMEQFVEANEDSRPIYTILGTTHENQADTVFVVGYWMNWFMKKLSAETAIQINNALILSFLNKQINYPPNVSDCEEYLLQESRNLVSGIPALKSLIKV
ncbi:hypothetical protein CBL_09461 [Carabus blaptoides fortunei]